MTHVIVYAGRHYGARCRVLERIGNALRVLHEPSGESFLVLACDTEAAK